MKKFYLLLLTLLLALGCFSTSAQAAKKTQLKPAHIKMKKSFDYAPDLTMKFFRSELKMYFPFKVVVKGKTLKEKKDYTYSMKNYTKVGTATLKIKGKGKYKGTITKKFKIKPVLVYQENEISFLASKYTLYDSTCNESRHQPSKDTIATFQLKSKPDFVLWRSSWIDEMCTKLKKNKDYKVSYIHNQKDENKGLVKIKGIGNYYGTITIPYYSNKMLDEKSEEDMNTFFWKDCTFSQKLTTSQSGMDIAVTKSKKVKDIYKTSCFLTLIH